MLELPAMPPCLNLSAGAIYTSIHTYFVHLQELETCNIHVHEN